MLSLASWQTRAQALPLAHGARVDHDCGGGRTLTIRHDEKGFHAFCFRCNDHGWLPPIPVPLEVRLKRLKEHSNTDVALAQQIGLPEPSVRSWADWPPKARLWLLKAGLSSHDMGALGAYYHPPSERVVLPVLGPSGALLFWQARSLDGRQPKYLAPPVDKARVTCRYGKARDVTLTEDILSAYKVSASGGEGWSMLGTSLGHQALAELVVRHTRVNVWLDPDPAGKKAAKKVLAGLRAAGVEARNIVSNKDPKLMHKGEIKELLL